MSVRPHALNQLIAALTDDQFVVGDWPALVEAAGETLTIGLLSERALASGRDMPPPIRELLVEVRDRTHARNARIREQFAELVPALNAVGIEPIPMKGLARLLGAGTSECRLLADIDILVPEDRREECRAAMIRLGYGPAELPDRRAPIVFARARDVGSVDVHTQLKPYHLQLRHCDLAHICKCTGISAKVLMPSPTAQALMLLAHDQLHDGDYWRGLIDLRHLLDLRDLASEGVDWAALAQFFPPGSSARALELGLLTANVLAGADVPIEFVGGSWASVQLRRRRLQAHFPGLQRILTLLTIAADPPRPSGAAEAGVDAQESWSDRLHRRLNAYLRPANPGKVA